VVISDSAAPEPSFYGVVGAALGLLVLVRIRRYRPDSIG
jgi:MYXO-CTERM domain-containing protein